MNKISQVSITDRTKIDIKEETTKISSKSDNMGNISRALAVISNQTITEDKCMAECRVCRHRLHTWTIMVIQ